VAEIEGTSAAECVWDMRHRCGSDKSPLARYSGECNALAKWQVTYLYEWGMADMMYFYGYRCTKCLIRDVVKNMDGSILYDDVAGATPLSTGVSFSLKFE